MLIKKGTSIGDNATIVCRITAGNFAMIDSGSVVTKNVPDSTLVFENPAITMDLFACMEENLS